MADVIKQLEYWKQGAMEDFDAATQLVGSGKVRHGLFFAHLALEKLLKACISKKTCSFAPRIHNLVRLAEISSLDMPESIKIFFAEMNAFNLEGRYPVPSLSPVAQTLAQDYIKQTGQTIQWLIQQLSIP